MTDQEYLKMAGDFTAMVKNVLAKIKAGVATDPEGVARSMPALISLVNTVGYLRGQDGILIDETPSGIDRKPLYAEEDACETELNAIIAMLLKSDQASFYRQRLESYFVKSRTGEKPDVL